MENMKTSSCKYFWFVFPLLLLLVLASGCTNPADLPTNVSMDIEPPSLSYKTYEMKEDDIRLQFMQYPLFSFEYPELFNLIDLNLIYEEKQAITMYSGVSKVQFTIQQIDLPEPMLTIRVQKQGFGGMDDANAAFRFWSSNPYLSEFHVDNTSTSKRMVFRIQADYLETFGIMEEYDIGGHLVYPERQRSFRGVFLIMTIRSGLS